MLHKTAITLIATISIGASLGCVDQVTPTSPPQSATRDVAPSTVTPALIRQLAAGFGPQGFT